MRFADIVKELRQRRVIRAAVIYLAVVWALLQAADLFAGADVIDPGMVRWLILLAAIGFPVVIIASWFLEAPWRERRWTNIAGDVVVILAIGLAAALFTWQQWFVSFTRPTVAVLRIESTDTSIETQDLADHLAKRFRMALSTRPELRVTEVTSSLHPSLNALAIRDRAVAVAADYLLTGTLSRNEQELRLTLQLYAAEGELLWSERFEDRLIDQVQLQTAVLRELLANLPVDGAAADTLEEALGGCEYPSGGDAILAIARAGHRGGVPAELQPYLEDATDTGLLQLAQARLYFAQLPTLPAPSRPVVQQLAMQALFMAAESCPGNPEIELLRLANTREVDKEKRAQLHRKSPECGDAIPRPGSALRRGFRNCRGAGRGGEDARSAGCGHPVPRAGVVTITEQ